MSAYTKDPGGSLIQFSTVPNNPGRAPREAQPPPPIARPGEGPIPHEPAASEHEFDLAMAQLEGPIRMMRSLREKIGLLERRREELETIVIRERATFRDQLGRAKKVISETGGALARTQEEAQRINQAGTEARNHLQQSAARLEAASSEIARLRQELDSANGRMNQTVTNFRARYAQDTGKLQQTIEQIKGRYAVELASFKQACTDLRTRAMSTEAAFKQLQAREGVLQHEAAATLNKLKLREHQIKKMALSSHLWASELERLRRENEGLASRAQVIPALEKEREHWRTVAEGEREQRRLVLDAERQKREKLLQAERELHAQLAEADRDLQIKVAATERDLQSKFAESERELKASHATEISRLETVLRLAREEIERLRQDEQKIRSDQGRAQTELFQACSELERAKVGETQARSELMRARAELESSGEQVRRLRFEGPIRELLTAKERELGRILEAARDIPPEDPARTRADQVIGLLGRQVEVLRGALSGNVPGARIVTPPPFPQAFLAAQEAAQEASQEIKPPPLPTDYVVSITSAPISE